MTATTPASLSIRLNICPIRCRRSLLNCTRKIRVKIVKSKYGGNDGIEVVLGGDSELSTAIEALEFITKTLKKEVKRNSTENY